MWFKQISFYILNLEKLPNLENLASKLTDTEFSPCMGLDWFSEGFSAPVSFSPELVFPAEYAWRVALKKEEKVLPAGVIRDILEKRILEIQEAEARHVGKKEKKELKEQITDDLLPRAFTRNSHTQAIFDTKNGFLFINQASTNKAEGLLTKLRETLGGLDVQLPQTKQSPSSLMTDWLMKGDAKGNFELDSDCELKGNGDIAPVIKILKQDLTADEVTQHLKNGKSVTQLGLTWRNQISFILTQELTFKRMQYLDVLQEEVENHGDDAASLTFASQLLMTEALSNMVNELVGYLGGWQNKE